MKFAIQLGNPHSSGPLEPEDETIAEALESIFGLYTEDTILVWDALRIPLGYKYDIAFIFEDILQLVEAITATPTGTHNCSWPSSSFRAMWYIRWDEEQVRIHAVWESVIGGDDFEDLLKRHPDITIPKRQFLGEWAGLLELCLTRLRQAEADKQIDLSRLEEAVNRIPERGCLYPKH